MSIKSRGGIGGIALHLMNKTYIFLEPVEGDQSRVGQLLARVQLPVNPSLLHFACRPRVMEVLRELLCHRVQLIVETDARVVRRPWHPNTLRLVDLK